MQNRPCPVLVAFAYPLSSSGTAVASTVWGAVPEFEEEGRMGQSQSVAVTYSMDRFSSS